MFKNLYSSANIANIIEKMTKQGDFYPDYLVATVRIKALRLFACFELVHKSIYEFFRVVDLQAFFFCWEILCVDSNYAIAFIFHCNIVLKAVLYIFEGLVLQSLLELLL